MRKQRFSVPLVGGLDTKRSDETIIQGKLVQADNVVFSDSDTLEVRAGLTDITYSPADAARLWAHDGRVCINTDSYDGSVLHSMLENGPPDFPRYLPEVTHSGISFSDVMSQTYSSYDFASNGTIYVTAAVKSGLSSSGGTIRPGILMSVSTAGTPVTNTVIETAPTITGAVTDLRVLITANRIQILYTGDVGGTNTIFFTSYYNTAPYAAVNGTTVSLGAVGVGLGFDAIYDSAAASAGATIVGWHQGAVNMRFLSLDEDGAILNTDNIAVAAGTAAESLVLVRSLSGGTYRFYAFYRDATVGATDISACMSGITGNGTALAYGGAGVAGATVATTSATNMRALTVVDDGTALRCYFTALDANSAPSIRFFQSINYTTLAGAVERYTVSGVHICGRAVRVAADDIRIMAYQQFTPSSASYLMVLQLRDGRVTGIYPGNAYVLGVLNPGNSGPLNDMFDTQGRRLTGCYATATEFSSAFLRAGDLFSIAGANSAGFSLDLVKLTNGGLGYVPADGATFLPGGFPGIVSKKIHEFGFTRPPIIVNAAFAGGTHLTAATAYSFVTTYMYVDESGNMIHSAPSAISSRTPGVNENGTFTVTCDTISRRANIKICLWRGISGNYYLDRMVDNVPNAVTTTLTTSGNDTTVSANEPLYTNGGVLSNQPLPACRAGCVWADRIFVTDGLRIHFTHKKEVNNGYEYAITNQIAVPSDWGRVVGLAGMDDKLVIFGEKKIGYLYGDGPTSAGTGDFSRPIAIVHNLGARWGTHKGIVVVDEGVWFQSPRGLRLLTRGMSIARRGDGVEFGSEVDDLNPGVATKPYSQTTVVNVVAACVLPSKPEVRFYMDNGTCLVLNRDWNQWSKFTNHTTTDAVAADKFYHIHDASTIRYYDEGSSTTTQQPVGDGAARTEFPVTLKTGKLSLAGIQGFARIYEAGWTVATDDAFTAASPVSFTLTATTDEGNSTAQVYTLSSQGSVEHFFALQPAYQKCSWVQMTMAFDPNSTGSTAASRFLGRIRFVNLTLLLGLKPGLSKQNRVKY